MPLDPFNTPAAFRFGSSQEVTLQGIATFVGFRLHAGTRFQVWNNTAADVFMRFSKGGETGVTSVLLTIPALSMSALMVNPGPLWEVQFSGVVNGQVVVSIA